MRALCLALCFGLAGCPEEDPPLTPPGNTPLPSWGVPISGGNLLVTRDGWYAVAADPDRDRIYVVHLATRMVIADVHLEPGDEPGRLAEDGAGRIHVALRRGGALVTLALPSGEIVARRDVCPEPRGVAWQGWNDWVHVACAGGELVTLPAGGGPEARRVRLPRDLRDVVVLRDQGLMVTRFRSAEVLTLDVYGNLVTQDAPPGTERAAVAWRAVPMDDGRVLVVHQRQTTAPLQPIERGYVPSSCGNGPSRPAISLVTPGKAPIPGPPIIAGALPVDVALAPDGLTAAFVMAGRGDVQEVEARALDLPATQSCFATGRSFDDGLGAPTSAAYTPASDLLIFYPEAPALVGHPRWDPVTFSTAETWVVSLPAPLGYDAGRTVFHQETPALMACATCHPEGREDGLVWTINGTGKRRTQTLAGHLGDRLPFHWNGDVPSLQAIMDDVFTRRMGGPMLTVNQRRSIAPFLERIPPPAPSPSGDEAQLARGEALFASQGCASCHAGALTTDNGINDVGTGGSFKTPSLLGVAARDPYLHDGCAPTLRDRFGACGGGDAHGSTSSLTPAQVDDLVAYLESL